MRLAAKVKKEQEREVQQSDREGRSKRKYSDFRAPTGSDGDRD